MKRLSKLAKKCLYSALFLTMGLFQTGCLQEQAPGEFYTFTGETIAEFLENRKDNFSDFIYCLKRANVWGEMRTYGEYTCFAPTNQAFEIMFQSEKYASKGITRVEDLTKEQCDTIAKTHLCNNTFFCTDLIDGALPYPNMLDRYLIYSTDSGVDAEGRREVFYRINKDSRILERDDTVQNGVVQIVDRIVSPSNRFLPDEIKNDPNLTLFYRILQATKMEDSLTAYIDPTYPKLPADSTDARYSKIKYFTGFENETGVFPEQRKFLFTAFAITDSVFAEWLGKDKNSIDLSDIEQKAKEIYDESYPEDAGKYDGPENYTNRKSPLNRFISYHLLPVHLPYNKLTISEEAFLTNFTGWEYLDVEEFYETMMPYSIMRVSAPKSGGGKYVNRKGTLKAKNLTHPGVRIWKIEESNTVQDALNGCYHYIDAPLVYSKEVREDVLNTRMRIMCETLSPDFINSGARGRVRVNESDRVAYGFKKGYCKNVTCSDATEYWARYRDHTFSCFFGEEITIRGQYDVTFRLPPVPADGTYEVRMYMCTMAGTSVGSDRGVVQIYMNNEPCGIPVDLRLLLSDPRVGGYPDSELSNEDAIIANDKAMRNRGYMKAMISYASNGENLRTDRSDCLRKILTSQYMYSNQDYHLRIRLVGGETGVCPFNCIEIVPKSVFAGEIVPEDRY